MSSELPTFPAEELAKYMEELKTCSVERAQEIWDTIDQHRQDVTDGALSAVKGYVDSLSDLLESAMSRTKTGS